MKKLEDSLQDVHSLLMVMRKEANEHFARDGPKKRDESPLGERERGRSRSKDRKAGKADDWDSSRLIKTKAAGKADVESPKAVCLSTMSFCLCCARG